MLFENHHLLNLEIMKKIIAIAFFCGLLTLTATVVSAQPYKTAVGLKIDAGDGRTFVGPHIKHFFSGNDAIQGMVLFGGNTTVLGAEYSYNKPFPNANGLLWNIGVGPQLAFWRGETGVFIRPQVGLEYKVATAPIAFGFDWRPIWSLRNDSEFIPARFGITFKYAF